MQEKTAINFILSLLHISFYVASCIFLYLNLGSNTKQIVIVFLPTIYNLQSTCTYKSWKCFSCVIVRFFLLLVSQHMHIHDATVCVLLTFYRSLALTHIALEISISDWFAWTKKKSKKHFPCANQTEKRWMKTKEEKLKAFWFLWCACIDGDTVCCFFLSTDIELYRKNLCKFCNIFLLWKPINWLKKV